jgi:isopentenyl-diphosphate delta-isomerase type 1
VNYQDEFFDVVNGRDEIIGRERRPEVHRLNLLHRAVHGFVFDSNGRLFLQKRSMLKDCFPGTWDSSFSGHVDAGEDYDQSVIREAREELGIHLDVVPEKLLKIPACEETGWEFTWLYRLQHEGPFTLLESEIDEGRWVTPDELHSWLARGPGDFAPSFLCCWNSYQLYLESSGNL